MKILNYNSKNQIYVNVGYISLYNHAFKCSIFINNQVIYRVAINKEFTKRFYGSARNKPIGFKLPVLNYGEELFNLIQILINIDQEKSNAEKIEKEKWKVVNGIITETIKSDKTLHVLKLPTGAGKTANIVQWLLYIIRLTNNLKMSGIDIIIILAPDYKNGINEIVQQIYKFDKFNTDFKILEGKYRTCKFNIYKDINEGINEVGLPLSTICNRDGGACKNDCKFYNDLNNIRSPNGTKFVITTHAQLTKALPIIMDKHLNILLVIDENFQNGIREDFDIYPDILRENIEFLKRVLYKKVSTYSETGKVITKLVKKKKKKKDYILYLDDLEHLHNFLLLFEEFIQSKIDYKKLDYALTNLKGLKETLSLLSKEGWYEYDNNEVRPFKKYLFYKIENFINNYFIQKVSKPENFDNWKENSIVRIDNETTEKIYLSFKFFELYKLNKVISSDKFLKIINMDATANVKDIKILFNKNNDPDLKDNVVIEHNAPYLYTNKIYAYQLMQKSLGHNYPFALFPKFTINNIKSFENLKKDIKSIVDAFPDVDKILFVSREMKLTHFNMDLWEYLKKYVSNKLECEPFGLASTNKYENYEVVIVLGTPIISTTDNKRESALLGRDPIERGEENARNTIKQAIGRPLRGTHDVHIFIIGGLDLKLDFPIKKIYKYQEIINDTPVWRSAHRNWRRTMVGLRKTREKEIKNKELIDYIKNNNNRITIKEYGLIINKSERTAGNKLNNFVDEGILDCRNEDRGKKAFFIKDKLTEQMEKYIKEFVKPFIQ